jgi:hypothetical protein
MIFINVVNAQQISSEGLSLLWVRYGAEGVARATCVIGSTVYVVGESGEGVVEARDINTGDLLYTQEIAYETATLVRVNVVHADGSAASGAYVCIDNVCKYADDSGAIVFSIQKGSYTIKAVKEYDVSGTKITYYGEKSINVSGDTGVELVIVPRLPNESGERCFWLRGFQLDKTTIQPNEYNSGFAEWIFAKCCPNCIVYVVVYDYNGEEIARLWEGGDYGYTHTVIQKSFSFKAPSNPGTYCLTINVAYDYKPPPPNEGIVEKTCFTVTSNLVTTISPAQPITMPITITQLITTTVTVTQPPKTYTITNTKIVTSTVPESTLTITMRPLFSEDLVALTISITMIVTSILIGIRLRRR